jgi:hypothetical protein
MPDPADISHTYSGLSLDLIDMLIVQCMPTADRIITSRQYDMNIAKKLLVLPPMLLSWRNITIDDVFDP